MSIRAILLVSVQMVLWNSVVYSQGTMNIPENYLTPMQLRSDPRESDFLRIGGHSEDYRLGPGDVIEVQLVGVEGYRQAERISNSGKITLPLLGEISAADKTAEELELLIAELFRRKELVKDPAVLVYISEYHGKPIYVLGEVDRPGEFVMTQQLFLVDAILIAGGLDFTAGPVGYLHRRRSGSDSSEVPVVLDSLGVPQVTADTEVIKIDLQPLKEGGMAEPNLAMRRGDVLFVPEREVEVYYVIGDVAGAGAYEIPQEQTLLATRAISWAGGPTKTAKMSQGVLVRYDSNGQRQELAVDFDAILKGKQPDFEVRPNDIIFIPGSSAKTVGYGLLGIIPRLAQSALIYGIIL